MDTRINHPSSWEDIISHLAEIVYVLQQHNVVVKPGSRLYNYEQTLKRFVKTKIPQDLSVKEIYQVGHEIHQLYHAVVELKKSNRFEDWISKFRFLTSGTGLPENDVDYSSRNYQFELYMAGMLSKVGLLIESCEPDIKVKWEGGEFGVAVKRLNSMGKVAKNLRSARNQIVRSGMPGIICMDISIAINPGNLIGQTESIDHLTDLIKKFLESYYDINYAAIKNIVSAPEVFGVVLHASALCHVNQRVGYASRSEIKNLCHYQDPHMEALEFFVHHIAKAC